MTLNACRTQSDAVIAFVVAIAGMILPAISASILAKIITVCNGVDIRLMSNLERGSMPNTIDRKFALAATKSSVSSSSLSKVKTAGAARSAPFCCSSKSLELSRRKLQHISM